MPSEKTLALKTQLVSEIAQEFRDAETLIIAEYGGLTVADDTAMRTDMRANGITYKVIKNTLGLRAAREAGFDDLDEFFVGKTAIAYSVDDVVAPARLIKKYADKFDQIAIKGGVMEGEVAPMETLQRLASIPDRDTLIARVVGGIAAPLSGLAAFLSAIREKMEEENAETAADVYVGPKSDSDAEAQEADTVATEETDNEATADDSSAE